MLFIFKNIKTLNKFLSKIKSLIPKNKRKKMPFFFLISIINSLLDFISIAFLTPFLLLIIDKEKVNEFLYSSFEIKFNEKYLLHSLICLVLFYLIKNLIQAKITLSQSKYLYGIGTSLSKKLIRNFIFGNYSFYSNTDKGKLIRDFHRLPVIFITNILLPLYHLISESFILLLITSVGLFLNPKITGVSIILVVLSSFVLIQTKKNKTKKINKITSITYQSTINNLMNILNGFIEIKSSESEEFFINKFDRSNTKHNNVIAELNTTKQNSIRYLEILTILLISFFLLFLFLNSIDFKNLILLSFFGSAIIKIIPSFNKLINSYIDINSNIHAIDILTTYNNETKKKHECLFNENIKINDISYNYLNKKSIINNLSLEINKGDFIVITGKSGCGKTTLLHIIAGLISPTNGEIIIDDNVRIANEILSFTYMLSQQPFIFQGTLLENITMNTNNVIDYNYINELINELDLKNWVSTLSNGLNTELNLDSKTISGGQKQRIALLRALYSKPTLLIMDEATNQLNTELEIKTLQYLEKKVLQNKLTIISSFHNKIALEYATKHYSFDDHSNNF